MCLCSLSRRAQRREFRRVSGGPLGQALNLGLSDGDQVRVEVWRLEAEEVEAKLADGSVLIDLRPPLAFAREHIEGSVNLQFNQADLADRADLVLPSDISVIMCAGADATARSGAEILSVAGLGVDGFLGGGLSEWVRAGRACTSTPVISVDDLNACNGEFQVIDARESYEYRYGHIAGARLLSSMEAWLRVEDIPPTGRYAVVCGEQVRSSLVASILRRAGRDALVVRGGMDDWLDRGFPVEKAGY